MNYEFNFSHHQSADSNEDWTHTAAVEQWKDISLLRKMDEGVGVKLKAQISNVPEVSRAVPPDEWLHHIDAVFSAGAAAVRPVEKWLAEPNAVNNALLSIGPQLDTAADYYSNAAPEQIVHDAESMLNFAAKALTETLGHPLTPAQRANIAGSVMPLLFGESTIETAQLPKMAEDVSADAVRESELSQLGIVRLARRAGNGGDWPVINERPAPDVVQQATRNGCVASVGEMLSDGKLKQSELLPQVATVPELLPKVLGAGWKCHGVADKEEAFAVLSRNSHSWSAELKGQFAHRVQMGHMVIVDGIDEAGNVMIRDPQHATRYEMTAEQFIKHWTGRAVWR